MNKTPRRRFWQNFKILNICLKWILDILLSKIRSASNWTRVVGVRIGVGFLMVGTIRSVVVRGLAISAFTKILISNIICIIINCNHLLSDCRGALREEIRKEEFIHWYIKFYHLYQLIYTSIILCLKNNLCKWYLQTM